jgi:CDP-paratose 2-epimerase
MKYSSTKIPGVVEWFAIGEDDRLEKAIKVLNELKIQEVRTCFSWTEWEENNGPDWFDYFIPSLAERGDVRLIPCLFSTPIHKAFVSEDGVPHVSNPPKNIEDYWDFVSLMIEKYGEYFDWVQVWNGPNVDAYWNSTLDPFWRKFSLLAHGAIDVIHRNEKKVVLGGLTPFEPQWLTLMHESGVLQQVDAIALEHSPGSLECNNRWFGWPAEIATAKAVLDGLNVRSEIWVTQTGFSTIEKNGEDYNTRLEEQVRYFEYVRTLPVDKVFWFQIFDQDPKKLTDDEINLGIESDKTAYHFGLIDVRGHKKPLYSHWKKIHKK